MNDVFDAWHSHMLSIQVRNKKTGIQGREYEPLFAIQPGFPILVLYTSSDEQEFYLHLIWQLYCFRYAKPQILEEQCVSYQSLSVTQLQYHFYQ